MDKIKKVFSPGSKKDDEVLYGDPAERRRESASKAPEEREPETLRPVEGAHKKEHSIMRQLINPGGEKYDDQRFGTTATTGSTGDPNKLETHPEAQKKDHTILGQVLNPGGDKYDPQRFDATASTEGDRRQSVHTEAPAVVGPDTKLETNPAEKKHQHSILRQIINPGGDKYDEEGYGTTAHAAGSLGNQPSDTKDHSIARQMLNPGQEKYDPVVHGGSGEPGPSAAGASSATGLQQPTQPTAGAAATSTYAGGTMTSRVDDTATPASCLSIKSGVKGPFASGADERGIGAGNTAAPGQSSMPGSQGTDFGRDAAIVGGGAAAAGAGAAAYSHERPKHDTTTTTATTTTTSTQQPSVLADRSATGASHINPVGAPETSAQQTGDSHLGRDAALAGGAGLAGGAAASQLNKPRDDVADATYTERSQPLAGSSQTYNPDPDRAMGTGPIDIGSASTGTQQTGTGTARLNPIGAPEESLEGQPRLGQDAAIAGGVGAAGVAAGSGVTQLNRAPDDVQQATYTDRSYPVGGATSGDGVIHHTSGPHQTETANKLDPHMPGEFPTETGEDRHGKNPTTLGGATAGTGSSTTTTDPSEDKDKQTIGSRILSAVGLGSNKTEKDASATEPATASKDYASPAAAETEQPSEHHYGRDAAVVGGLGAAGAGAYAATRDNDTTARPAEPRTEETQTTRPAESTVGYTQTSQPSAMSQPTTTSEKVDESHTGRNAALAGGAGAAGVGTYEASKNTGPASKTYGPHESNIANVMDPRVKMEPEKMKESTTAGPHSSDMANKMDPRVEADPAKNHESHYGRDAAIAGGAGVGGAGAYTAMRDDKPTTSQQQQPHTVTTSRNDTTDPAVIAARRAGEKEAHPSATADKHDKHDKKHDKSPEEESGEKKRGLLDKILHPSRKSEDKEAKESSSATRTSVDSDGHNKLHKKAVPTTDNTSSTDAPSGTVIEPHTGLPMNVSKYGTDGAGGTDGATQIGGYHETDPAVRRASMGTAEGAGTKNPAHQPGEEGVAGPDWDAIKKANTPY